jgi:nucleoside-diphosphate-sugar epimerase
MRVVVSGATGTIRAAVVEALRRRGDTVVALDRAGEAGHPRLAGAEHTRLLVEAVDALPETDAQLSTALGRALGYTFPQPALEPALRDALPRR